ncbi:hypothetical protein GCM10010193_70250 [Kitasatospora atroaurantiaca]|uniref:Uncharacterized protein n=1 Tax=Kitasatospora atroaurantiaca TaxID=285545 RepID=A0A561ENA8_9ACTN|nr:hypothetical protein [Kitasatospora atroaurantiaca]TWE17111.1 hypothetical protein FB465_2116 [Kitasatospora atroaurantiaca]
MAPNFAMPKSAPEPAALTPALPDDADLPLKAVRTVDGIVAAYSPAQLDRPAAWGLLTELAGTALRDITPAWMVAA